MTHPFRNRRARSHVVRPADRRQSNIRGLLPAGSHHHHSRANIEPAPLTHGGWRMRCAAAGGTSSRRYTAPQCGGSWRTPMLTRSTLVLGLLVVAAGVECAVGATQDPNHTATIFVGGFR